MAKMRVTYHNGRSNKQGVYSAKHNDRNFDTQTAEHIEPSKAEKNIYWHYYQDIEPSLSFEEVERKYYTEHFSNYLVERNNKSIKQGHKERVQSIEDYQKSKKSCPEETLFQVGNINQSVSKETLKKIFALFSAWQKEQYPQVVLMNWAYHADEQGAGHIHARQVWVAHDKNGNEMVNQGQALAEMGVERPETDKKEGRYNNAKMTYTQKSREKFAEICRENGVEIEDKPLEASKTGKDLAEWQAEQDRIKLEKIKAEQEKAEIEYKEKLAEIAKAETYLSEIEKEANKEKNRANEMRDMADIESVRLSALDVGVDVQEKKLKSLTAEAKAEQKRAETEKQKAEENKALADAENARLETLRVANAERQKRLNERIKILEAEMQEKEKKLVYQKIEIEAKEKFIQDKNDEIKSVRKNIIEIEEQRQAIKDKINEGNDILDNIEADLDSIVAVVEEYQNKLINAHKTKNYKEELKIVKEFLSWYNPNGRRELEQFFEEVPRIAQNIKVKITPTKNNDKGRGWTR